MIKLGGAYSDGGFGLPVLVFVLVPVLGELPILNSVVLGVVSHYAGDAAADFVVLVLILLINSSRGALLGQLLSDTPLSPLAATDIVHV